jgi:hypothetical protein
MFSLKGNRYFLFILTSLLIYNCSESTEPDYSNLDLIPLAVGNKWNYKTTTFDSTGNVINQQNGNTSIIKDTLINGIKWYGYDHDFPGVWNTNKSDGYWQFLEADSLWFMNDTSGVVYKFPTHVGDVYGNPQYPKEVVSVNERISVPAGDFRTIHITQYLTMNSNSLQVSFETYICPGIGFVKSMQIGKKYDGTKYIVGKSELVSHNIKRNLYNFGY